MMKEKILIEEILFDNELEKFSGGTIPQTAQDSEFLYEH